MKKKINWLAFCVHFVFGFIIGGAIGFIGFLMWMRLSRIYNTVLLTWFIIVGAITCGLIAGIKKDAFWEKFQSNK